MFLGYSHCQSVLKISPLIINLLIGNWVGSMTVDLGKVCQQRFGYHSLSDTSEINCLSCLLCESSYFFRTQLSVLCHTPPLVVGE